MAQEMKTRPLGRTGLQVSEFGFGAGPLGGFYGPVSSAEAAATVDAMWEAGCRYYDTAPLYGYGRSELRLGHVLREKPRDSYVLSTKVARHFVPLEPGEDTSGLRPGGLPFRPRLDYSYDGALRSLEHSLLRLGIERADIVLLHDLDDQAHGQEAERYFREAEQGAYKALDRLRSEGTIKAVGIGVNRVDWAIRLIEAMDLDCVLIAGRYTLLNQEALPELYPLCQKRGIGMLAAGPFNGGLLARGVKPGVRYNYGEAPPEVVERLKRLNAVCDRWQIPIRAAALQFSLAHPAVASVVTGAMSRSEVEDNLAGLQVPIPDDFWAELRAEGLIPA